MIKRILHSIIWLLIVAWFTVIMGFVTSASEKVICRNIDINISDSLNLKFVTSGMIRESISATGISVEGSPVESIQTRELERRIEQNPYVANAEVFVSIDGVLKINVLQRIPVIRIMPDGKSGYYLDENGNVLPLSESFFPMVLLLTGYIDFEENENNAEGMLIYTEDAEVKQLLQFADYVRSSPFWQQQIVQLYRGRDATYELIPRVGAHQILFGSLDDFEKKLRNLYLLYEQGFSAYGWNTYDKINLKYSNQIICTKR